MIGRGGQDKSGDQPPREDSPSCPPLPRPSAHDCPYRPLSIVDLLDLHTATDNMLFSVQHKKKKQTTTDQNTTAHFHLPPTYITNPAIPSTSTTPLGPLDALFAQTNKRPTYVELLLLFSSPLDLHHFTHALQATLPSFPSACGRRHGTTIEGNEGVLFSACTVKAKDLLSAPPSPLLFDTPTNGEVLTLRLATSLDNTMCGLGIVFDHAWSDVSGPSLFLSHLSYHYTAAATTGTPAQHLPPRPSFKDKREQQAGIKVGIAPPSSTTNDTKRTRERLKGGVACVEFTYDLPTLIELKSKYKARSRHEAAFTDIILLWQQCTQHNTASSLLTATISRDDRVRYGLEKEHFGNGIVLVEANYATAFQNDTGDTGDSGDTGDTGDTGNTANTADTADTADPGIQIAAALRRAVQHGIGRDPSKAHAGIHLNTWWHPLQRQMSFGLRAQPQFVVGPSSLAAAGQICVARNGQPNVTILPNEKGSGLKMYLMAPLQQAHIFLSVVKKQMKKNKQKNKNKNRNGETKETATSQAPSSSRASRRRPSSPILPGAIVWLHGLGDTSHSWDSRFASYFTMEKGRFLQPTAPEQHVTAHISTATTTAPPTVSWFDIQTLPISVQEPGTQPIAGLEESVATIHALLDELQTIHHVLPRNIVLGGFSQGGALAIEAGTTYAHALAGIVSISGWCPNRQASKQFTTPIFFSSGTSDPVVLYEMSKESCNCLVQWSANMENTSGSYETHQSVVRNVVQRGKHAPKGKELKAASVFIKQCLGSVPPGVL